MRKYFYLQLKLCGKLLPFVLGVTLALVLGLGMILSGLLANIRSDEKSSTFTVALCGDTDNNYLQWGLAALQLADDAPFSISAVEMPQQEAHAALETGKISAYVIMPEGMMEKALAGEDFEPVTYVTAAGLEGFSGYLKRELTTLVSKIVIYSQKGTYGLAELLEDYDLDEDVSDHMTALALEYADLIIHRDALYRSHTLGVSDGLSTADYYVCAVIIMLLMLMGLPYAAIYIRRDHALARMLSSRGFSAARQLLCEYAAHLFSMLILGGLLIVLTTIVSMPGSRLALRLLPVLGMIAALNILVFALSDNMVSGLLLHFFGAIGLCYVSGCIYPVTAFPIPVQKLANILPTGIARHHLSTAFSYKSTQDSLLGLLAYTLVFLGLALLVRIHKTTGIER